MDDILSFIVQFPLFYISYYLTTLVKKVKKGVWGMPRLSEAMKDVISCDKPRGLAHTN